MATNALYTDLSGYYDLMCCDINYLAQSNTVLRLHRLFGNGGKTHLDLACGTGPHIQHFLAAGYQCTGLDLNLPMLEIARQRCPDAHFMLDNMCHFTLSQPVDLITCFLYSLHYTAQINALQQCITQVYTALKPGGVFCFNAVDKNKICNLSAVSHRTRHLDSLFEFSSAWFYSGQGEQQALRLSINKTDSNQNQYWQDEHSMVAISFDELEALLNPYFEVHRLAHDYECIQPWQVDTGNALFVCIKRSEADDLFPDTLISDSLGY
ncbi:class I SAM-dependent DNA methyltransferase [Alishewanella longhuensis]|uniref:class I SAM-dependent DNA methyltransferase n=1 Tax=Alishewanella longhuensis TaxID=1091037 RepID=UPI001678BFCF|nr:class I SAM-dependent methyltransferase [Alishewanella longhuensis]